MRTFGVIALMWLVLISMGIASEEELSVERQIQIISDYGLATGQMREIPTWALAELEEKSRGTKCGTPAALEFSLNYDRLDRELMKSLGVDLVTRPTYLTDSLDSESGLFRIHYSRGGTHAIYEANVDADNNGHPDFIDLTADVMDSVYWHLVDTLGYPEPLRDGYEPGGDDKYDVYMVYLSPAYYGFTQSDSLRWGGPQGQSIVSTSFLLLRTDYTVLPTYANRPEDALRVTAAHEFFHAVQFAMDITENEGTAIDMRPYWMEMSAVYMEEEVYDQINDYYLYLDAFYKDPTVSLQQFASSIDQHPYASSVWCMLLAQTFGRDAIREIWKHCSTPGPSFLEAADFVIDSISNGSANWSTFFSEFNLANYFAGPRADILPVERHVTRFWNCDSGQHPNCTDSTMVSDTILGYEWMTVDTVLFNGYEEGANYPGWPDTVMSRHAYRDYPVLVTGNDNPDRPQPNSFYYMSFENLGLVGWDTTYWNCLDGVWPSCSDSVEVEDPLEGYEFMAVDSAFTIWMSLGDGQRGNPSSVPTLKQGWGSNFIFQLESNLDSFFVESSQLPDDIVYRRDIENLWEYRSVGAAFSPATPDTAYYNDLVFRLLNLGYLVGDTILIDSSRIFMAAGVLDPFPNPAVVADLAEPKVEFKFQVSTNERALPLHYEPHLVVDIYNLAGERVATLDSLTRSEEAYLGIHYAEWDLKNQHGSDVASGVYIAYGRLYTRAHKGVLLAEDYEKVAIIR